MSVILFLIILAVLIVSHEFGHFIVAKRAGIRVDEFAVGFPPKLLFWIKGETRYSLNLLPFGGFVKIYGEDPTEEIRNGPDAARAFTGKPRYVQAMVVAAGIFFNLLLAWLLFSVGFMAGLPSPVSEAPEGASISDVGLTVVGILPDSPAAKAGLKAGDRITALGTDTTNPDMLDPEHVQSFVSSHPKEKIAVVFERGKKTESVIVTPQEGLIEGKAAIGVSLDLVGTVSLPPHRALWQGTIATASLTKATVIGLYELAATSVRGEGAGLSALTGPVGIVGLVGDASQFGFAYLLSFTALISINLAVLNLIPFPALDGGRLLFIGIEAITRRTIPSKVANTLNAAGFVLLIILMLVVTYHDIARLLG